MGFRIRFNKHTLPSVSYCSQQNTSVHKWWQSPPAISWKLPLVVLPKKWLKKSITLLKLGKQFSACTTLPAFMDVFISTCISLSYWMGWQPVGKKIGWSKRFVHQENDEEKHHFSPIQTHTMPRIIMGGSRIWRACMRSSCDERIESQYLRRLLLNVLGGSLANLTLISIVIACGTWPSLLFFCYYTAFPELYSEITSLL